MDKYTVNKDETRPLLSDMTYSGDMREDIGGMRPSPVNVNDDDYDKIEETDLERSTTSTHSTHSDRLLTQSGTYIIAETDSPVRLTTSLECLMHLLKGMIGTGILAMPIAYKNGGLWVSMIVIFVIGIICTHCMHLLVICSNELAVRTKENTIDYAIVAEKAFETNGPSLRKFSKAAKNVINAFLITTQFGFCCVYTVFVAQNIQQVVQHIHPNNLNVKLYIVFVSVCLVPYIMVKSLKALVPFSAFANILNTVGLLIIMINLFQGLGDAPERPAFGSFATLPLFFGQAVFAFEGIGLVLPLYSKMEKKNEFLGKAGVVNFGLTVTVCLYNAVGFYGYLKFGDDAKGSVTLNMPDDEWLYLSVNLMFAISLYISYGLQFYVPINIIWPFMKRKIPSLPNYTEYIFRFFIVCFTCGLSSLIPHLDLLIALVGAMASSFLALIFPPFIELVTFRPTAAWIWVKNIVIMSLGLLGFVTGTYSAMSEIIQKF